MFEEPTAKRVRREELYGSDGSDRSDAGDSGAEEELRARLNAQIAKSLGLGASFEDPRPGLTPIKKKPVGKSQQEKSAQSVVDDGHDETSNKDDNESEEEGYEFRLFNTSGAAPKVVIKDDDELMGDGAIQNPRPISFYLVTDVSADVKEQYLFAALTADDVYARSRQRCWGLEMPWKVRSIEATHKAGLGESGRISGEDVAAQHEERKRRRPGKKKRIKIRTREKTKKEKAQVAAQQAVEKEEHIRDKKKRLNRLKKLRRRAKDKEKKAATGGEGGSDDSE